MTREQKLEAALRDMVAAAENRWRSLPPDSFEKQSLNNAKAALKA